MTETLSRMEALKPELIQHRRTLHENPELGFDLPKTIKYVTDTLKSYGYEPQLVGKAGIVAVVGKPGGKTFLIRGDMDALPMAEQTGLPFASKNGWMHACGHDIHTSALLGAAKVLKERESELSGQVKLMFQPAEERMTGAADMVKAGVLKNPDVDAAMALHVVHEKLGTVGRCTGFACGSSDLFKIKIKGRGGHGAAPHMNVDPIQIACHIQLALQEINSREVHPDKMVVLTVCMLNAGTAPNITPETAELQGSIRTMDNEVRAFVKRRLVEISESVARVFRGSCEVEFESEGIPPMFNDEQLLKDVSRYVDDMLGCGTCYDLERMTGSEDFSVLSQRVPSLLMWIGTGSDEEGYSYGVHDPRVTFNEEAIPMMAAIYAESAIRWLKEHK